MTAIQTLPQTPAAVLAALAHPLVTIAPLAVVVYPVTKAAWRMYLKKTNMEGKCIIWSQPLLIHICSLCDRFLNVSCANNEAKFYIKRFARGSVGKCILFKKRWITPNEFQAISGRKSSKDWKRSIRLKGRCLKEFITQGLFQEHAKTCACKICSGDDVDILKQEGEMALAAKRRRLSQADTHSITPNEPHGVIGGGPPPLLPQAPPPTTFEQPEPMEDMNSSSKRSSTELDRGDGGIVTPQKIWSPSGGKSCACVYLNHYQCPISII